jgi:Protein of unknown function (DUF1573)
MHFLLSLLLLCALPGKPDAKGHITWLTPSKHDFGEIPSGKPVVFNFQFRNDAPKPMRIDLVRPDCGCTAAKYTETPVQPGDIGTVSIEFDAAQSGAFRKKILVFFDGQQKGSVLRIRGAVI